MKDDLTIDDAPSQLQKLSRKRKSSRSPDAKLPSTLAEVARLSGFSTATVSRTFNEPEKVKLEVRRRITDVAELLRYRPNRLVSGVLRGRVPIVGIVINVLNAAFIPELLGGIFEACERAGFSCMVYDSNAEPEREVDALKLCIQHRLAGVLLFPLDKENHERNKILAEIDELGMPVISMMSSVSTAPDAPLVANNDYQGALEAVTHLIELGHTEILHLSGSQSHYRTSDERVRGYLAAHIRAGLKIRENLIRSAGFGPQIETWNILRELEAAPGMRPYTAIFAATDYTAIKALQFFYKHGIRVPEQVSVAGFGDLPMSDLTFPPLTTVNQNFHQLGMQSAQVCIALSEKQDLEAESPQLIPVRLVVRESTGPAPGLLQDVVAD